MNTPKAKHTPGPWIIRHEQGSPWPTLHGKGSSGWIAQVPMSLPNQANARLIAAAPDLLAVLEGLVNSVDEYGLRDHAGATITEKETATAHAAIAKARGTE